MLALKYWPNSDGKDDTVYIGYYTEILIFYNQSGISITVVIYYKALRRQ